MKKLLIIFLSVLLAVSAFALVACDTEQPTPDPTPTPSVSDMKLVVHGDKELDLDVGVMYKITVSTKGTTQGVSYVSSDPTIVDVDDYGNLDLKTVGTATITVALVEDPSIKEVISVKVSKTFFYDSLGLKNGDFDVTYEDDGLVQINGGQTQMLVTECGQYWYFKVNLEHTGKYTNDDAQGRYGVGSFYVTDATPIGEVMAWFGFKPDRIYQSTFVPYVGGWRVASGGNDPEIDISPIPATKRNQMDCSGEKGATIELIRYGTTHYVTFTGNDCVAKYVYDCPSLDGKDTYPGVYSQQQIINVWDFSVSTDMDEIMAKLNAFQSAESISMDGIGDTLVAGQAYNLSATVLPSITYDKSVTFELTKGVDGVTLANGVLTVADNAIGEITVKVTANSNTDVSVSKTYNIIAKPQSSSEIFDSGVIIGNAQIDGNSFTANGESTTYVPLLAKGDKWSVSLDIPSASGTIGLLAATNGYFDYVDFAIDTAHKISYGAFGKSSTTFAYLTGNAATSPISLQIVKDGEAYYVIVNDRLVKKVTVSSSESALTPVLYADCAVTIANVAVVTDGTAIDNLLAGYAYTAGAYVGVNGESYIIAAKDFGNDGNINWPPVNDYDNGIKSAKSFTGDFTVEFTVSNIQPMLSGSEYDSKLLVYLRSEATTASIQFVFKGTAAAPTIAFCPNLNDATWTEYPIEDINLLEGSHTIKIEKKDNRVRVFIDDVRVFRGNDGLNNNGYWTEESVCTPGIGTFRCGATISDVSFSAEVSD